MQASAACFWRALTHKSVPGRGPVCFFGFGATMRQLKHRPCNATHRSAHIRRNGVIFSPTSGVPSTSRSHDGTSCFPGAPCVSLLPECSCTTRSSSRSGPSRYLNCASNAAFLPICRPHMRLQNFPQRPEITLHLASAVNDGDVPANDRIKTRGHAACHGAPPDQPVVFAKAAWA